MTTDPLEHLFSADEPVEPTGEFREALRGRLRDVADVAVGKPATAVATPYLSVVDAAAALDFYVLAFGADELFRVPNDEGVVDHAEFVVAGARFMLAEEWPAGGAHSPQSLGGTSVRIHLQVDDVDRAVARAAAVGCSITREVADQPHGSRTATLADPFGHLWILATARGTRPDRDAR